MSHRRFTHRFRRALRAGVFAAAAFGMVRVAHTQPPGVPQPSSQSSQPALGAYRPPSLALVQPARGTPVPQDRPVAVFRYSAGEANDPVDPRSFQIAVDGADRTRYFAVTAAEAWGLLGPADSVGFAPEDLLAIGGHDVSARICSVRGACSTISEQVTVAPGLDTSRAEEVPTERKRRNRLIELLLDAARAVLVRPGTITSHLDSRISIHTAQLAVPSIAVARGRLSNPSDHAGLRVGGRALAAGVATTVHTPDAPASRRRSLADVEGRVEAALNCQNASFTTVSPCDRFVMAPPNATGQTVVFTVTNQDMFSRPYSFECSSWTTPVTSCSVFPQTVSIGGGSSESVTVTYSTGNGGNGSLTFSAHDLLAADEAWALTEVGVPLNYLAVDASRSNNDNQDVSLCANNCFAATYSQSTVPYISMDTPRGVTLVYHGDRVGAKPFIHAEVSLGAGAPTLSRYRLQAQINGAAVTFLNGESILHFAAASPSTETVRLGGQFDASSFATGRHPLTITVTAVYSNGKTEQKVTSGQVLVVDERKSSVARGWTVAGLQRVHELSGGALLITDGSGSAAYFANDCGTGCYTSPQADFTKVTSNGSGYVRAYRDSTKATFDTAGRLTSLADRFGNTTDFDYDASGRLTKIYDPYRTYNSGASRSYIALGYGAFGLSQIQEPGPDGSPTGGRITAFTVASDSTLRVFKDPDGDSTVFGYDGLQRLDTIIDRRGGLTTYEYHASSGKLEWVDLPTVALYDNTNARPRVSYSPWHTAGVPTGPTQTTPATPVIAGSVTGSTTDPLGRQASFTTDRWGQPLGITDPVGRTTTITRNGLFPSSIQRPTGATDYTSFSGGLLTSATPAGQTATHVRYGGWAQPDSIYGVGRGAQRRYIGENGQIDSVRVAGIASVAKYYYDTRGRVDSVIDPGGHVTKYHYDAVFGNLDSTLAPGNRFTKLTFDGHGRLLTQQSNDEPLRQVVYDSVNRVREVDDGVNDSTTKYTYDQLFLTRVEDPKEQVFRFEHNALGWVTRKYDPADTLNRYESFGYDLAGNVRQWTNRRGQQISFTYDSLNRPLSKTGTNTTADSLWYSSNGLKMASWNAVSTDSIYFDSTGWVDSVVTLLGGQKFKRAYTATNVQQLDTVTISGNSGITFAQRRFAWNSLTGALDTAYVNGQATRFTRNQEMLPTQTIWPSITRTHQWTDIHRPAEQSFSDATVNTALFRRYGYDSRSQLQDRIRWDGSNFRTQQAGYDGLRRLGNQGDNLYSTTQCPWDAASGYLCPTSFQHQVTFDAGGNRTDAANAAYLTGNRIHSFATDTFSHDLDGNLTQKYDTATNEDKRFEWSAEGRLLRVLINGNERVRYDYNASGVLVRRWTNGVLDRHFLWDQGHLLAELDSTATERIGEYAYLPGADQPLALITGAQSIAAVRYFVQDEVGNVVALLNGTTLDQQVLYDYWGVPTVTGSTDNRLFFKGLLWESNATGMYYVRARWYDPELGRFVSQDPAGIGEGTNYYTFAGSDPVNGWDPSGAFKFKDIFNINKWTPTVAAFATVFVAALAGPMTVAGAFAGTVEAFGATAIGAGLAAGLETTLSGGSFKKTFKRNMNIASWGLMGSSAFAWTVGGGVQTVGANGLFQGFLQTREKTGIGMTFGSSAILRGPRSTPLHGLGTTLGQHELGHTAQFIFVNSQVGGLASHFFGSNWDPYLTWGSYGLLGGVGLAGQLSGYGPLLFWERWAGTMGGGWYVP